MSQWAHTRTHTAKTGWEIGLSPWMESLCSGLFLIYLTHLIHGRHWLALGNCVLCGVCAALSLGSAGVGWWQKLRMSPGHLSLNGRKSSQCQVLGLSLQAEGIFWKWGKDRRAAASFALKKPHCCHKREEEMANVGQRPTAPGTSTASGGFPAQPSASFVLIFLY